MGQTQPIHERVASYSTDVVANLASLEAIDISPFRRGSIGGADAATLTFYGCGTATGTFRLIEGSDSTDLSLVKTADRWSQLPAALFDGPRYIKIVNDLAQEDFELSFKS